MVEYVAPDGALERRDLILQICRAYQPVNKSDFIVGDEVTSLNILLFLKDKLETPHVVSYFLTGCYGARSQMNSSQRLFPPLR